MTASWLPLIHQLLLAWLAQACCPMHRRSSCLESPQEEAMAGGDTPKASGRGRGALFPEWSVHASMLVLQASLGLYHVLAKLALREGVDQLVFCIYRDLIALILLGPPAYFLERSVRPPISGPLLRLFILLGATGVLGNQLLFLIGLNLTGPATAAALQPSIQVFTFGLALILGVETLEWRRKGDWAKVAGVAVCFAGAMILGLFRGPTIWGALPDPSLAFPPPPAAPQGSQGWGGASGWHLGVLSLLGNCFCMALYITLQSPVLAQFPAPLSVTALAYVFGAAMMVLLGLLFSSAATVWTLTPSQLLAVFYAGVVNSALGYFLLAWANKRLGPSAVALYTPLQPLSSALLARVILGSSLFLGSALGGVLVLGGLYLYIWGKAASNSSNSLSSSSLSSSPSSRSPHSVFLANEEDPETDGDSDRAPLAGPQPGFLAPRG